MSAALTVLACIVAGLAVIGGLLALGLICFFLFSAEPETTSRDIDL